MLLLLLMMMPMMMILFQVYMPEFAVFGMNSIYSIANKILHHNVNRRFSPPCILSVERS